VKLIAQAGLGIGLARNNGSGVRVLQIEDYGLVLKVEVIELVDQGLSRTGDLLFRKEI
jgi:hypothetical protein